jgi:hypothetical protein
MDDSQGGLIEHPTPAFSVNDIHDLASFTVMQSIVYPEILTTVD